MTQSNNVYVVERDGRGAGGFLCPPGHPNLTWRLDGYEKTPTGQRRKEPFYSGALDGALAGGHAANVPSEVRTRVEKVFADAKLVCSELWLRQVYGYFFGMYSTDGTRNVSTAKSAALLTPEQRVPERHLAVMCVREYFPDHQPRHDLITPPAGARLYGQYPCGKCGTRVQYEPRADALCPPLTSSRDCSRGGLHEWGEGPAAG